MHEGINAVANVALLISVTDVNLLIGPSVCGLLGSLGLVIVDVYVLLKVKKQEAQ